MIRGVLWCSQAAVVRSAHPRQRPPKPSRPLLRAFPLPPPAAGGAGRPLVGGAARVGNLPLASLRQIGDVVLVHDEGGLYEQDLDGRLGFVNPIGLEVRTAAGDFLGKVRGWGRVAAAL